MSNDISGQDRTHDGSGESQKRELKDDNSLGHNYQDVLLHLPSAICHLPLGDTGKIEWGGGLWFTQALQFADQKPRTEQSLKERKLLFLFMSCLL